MDLMASMEFQRCFIASTSCWNVFRLKGYEEVDENCRIGEGPWYEIELLWHTFLTWRKQLHITCVYEMIAFLIHNSDFSDDCGINGRCASMCCKSTGLSWRVWQLHVKLLKWASRLELLATVWNSACVSGEPPRSRKVTEICASPAERRLQYLLSCASLLRFLSTVLAQLGNRFLLGRQSWLQPWFIIVTQEMWN